MARIQQNKGCPLPLAVQIGNVFPVNVNLTAHPEFSPVLQGDLYNYSSCLEYTTKEIIGNVFACDHADPIGILRSVYKAVDNFDHFLLLSYSRLLHNEYFQPSRDTYCSMLHTRLRLRTSTHDIEKAGSDNNVLVYIPGKEPVNPEIMGLMKSLGNIVVYPKKTYEPI